MKAELRKLARTMAGWPVVGRLVRIAVAVIRLPEALARMEMQRSGEQVRIHEEVVLSVSRSREGVEAAIEAARLRLQSEIEAMRLQLQAEIEATREQLDIDVRGSREEWLAALTDSDRRLTVLAEEQLPGLLLTLSDLNHRVVARNTVVDNLVRSVPVALRTTTRETLALREQVGQLDKRLQAASGGEHGWTALGPRVAEVKSRADGLAESVSYLLGRVEFVRRELMFEMRYGAASPGAGEKDALRAKAEIIDGAKVEAARATGLRVNLGCGHVPLDGYLNIDRRELPGVDVVAEVDDLPFQPGELDEVFSAHLLEHFPQEALRRQLLGYWLGLLKPGGTFGAVLPDGDGMARAYLSKEYGFEQFRQVTFGGQDYDGDFHYNMLSPESLTALLTEAGFSDVRVIVANRENGGCKEFEIRATRP